jgi:uncharacterized coiled-coil protein SlyX
MGARAGRALRHQNSYAILRIPKNLHARQNPQIMKKILLNTLTPFRASLRNSTTYASSPCGFVLIPLILVCFALCQQAQSAAETPTQKATNRPVQSAADAPEQVQRVPNTPDPGPLPLTNTADGQNALLSITTGIYNSAFGIFSLLSLTDGNFCTGVGAGALFTNTASENTAVGAGALFSNGTGGTNTAVGAFALFNHATGVENTAVGREALLNDTSSNDNTAVGMFALLNNVDGGSNTAIGVAALRDNVSGGDNCALGRGALRLNEGSGNIAIGREAGTTPPLTGQYNNTILLGILGDADALDPDGRAYIGNVRDVATANLDAVPVLIDSSGQLGTINSSRRFKKDIRPMDQTSEVILALKPVTFHYKDGDTKKARETPQYGLIAEDVAAANPDLIVRDKDGKIYSVRYDAVNVMLLNEFLKEHKKVEAQQATIAELKSTVAQQQKGMEVLTAQLKEQGAQIQKVSAQLKVSKPAAQVVSYGQ